MSEHEKASPHVDTEDYMVRLEEQLKYHSAKSRENKTKFHRYQILIIMTAALIPIANAFNLQSDSLRIVTSILGGIVVIVTALLQLYKHQENWILFRTTQELLKKEKAFYLNSAGDYCELSPEEKKKLLVERVESLISSETSKYFAVHSPRQFVEKDSTPQPS